MKPSDPGRREIETIMEQAERQAKKMNPPLDGEYTNYDFRPRKDHPGLQCVDSLAWMFYQIGLDAFHGKQSHPLAHESWADYGKTLNRGTANLFEWITAMSITRDDLQQWVDQEKITNKAKNLFLEWEKEKNEQKARDEQSGDRKIRCGNGRTHEGATRGHQGQTGRRESAKAQKVER